MLSIIFGPRQAYTTLATFPTLRCSDAMSRTKRCIAILKAFVEGKKVWEVSTTKRVLAAACRNPAGMLDAKTIGTPMAVVIAVALALCLATCGRAIHNSPW